MHRWFCELVSNPPLKGWINLLVPPPTHPASTMGESPQIFWAEVFLEYQPPPLPRLSRLYSSSTGAAQRASVCAALPREHLSLAFHKSHGQNQVPKFLGTHLHILSFVFLIWEKAKEKKTNYSALKWARQCLPSSLAWETWKEVRGKFTATPHSTSTNLVASKALIRLSTHLINK